MKLFPNQDARDRYLTRWYPDREATGAAGVYRTDAGANGLPRTLIVAVLEVREYDNGEEIPLRSERVR
jgi:hypothetical protein